MLRNEVWLHTLVIPELWRLKQVSGQPGLCGETLYQRKKERKE